MTARVFEKGRQVTDVHEIVDLILAGQWLYIDHKAYSPGWTINLSLIQLSRQGRHGQIWIADRRRKDDER